MRTRLFNFGLLVSLCVVFVSCRSARLPQKLDDFVDNAELKSSTYGAKDWQRSMREYELLVAEYSSSGKRYTEAEKQMVARAMGRYHALLIKNGVEQAAVYLKELESIVPSYLEGLVEGLEENSGDIRKSLERLLDEEKMEKTIEDIGGRLENIFEYLGEE